MEWIASVFSFQLIIFSLFPVSAGATTFGPIQVTEQIRGAQYIAHGITSRPTVAEEPKLHVPYTYWKLSVLDQPLGAPLGPEIDIRSPGGELGDLGYHIAGTAQFKEGDEVFVFLRDTDDRNAKEIVGLASGKYGVTGKAGEAQGLTNGIGLTLVDSEGKAMTPDDFTRLIRRVANNDDTSADRTIFVNRNREASHGNEHGEVNAAHPHLPLPPKADALSPSSESSAPIPIKNTANDPEKFPTGTSGFWWVFALVSAGLILALFLRLRR